MKIIATNPYQTRNGDLLGPADLNRLFDYCGDALSSAAGYRYDHHPLVFSFVTDVLTPYTETTPQEVRTYRFLAPVTCIVERAFLDANLVSSASVDVTIVQSGTSTPPVGATVPWLTTSAASASSGTDITDLAPGRVLLVAGQEYEILVSTAGAGTFSLERFDVTLDLLVDRFTPAGADLTPSFSPTRYTDATAADATLVNADAASLNTAAAVFLARISSPVPVLLVDHNFVTGTDPLSLRMPIPRSDTAWSKVVVSALRMWAVMATTAGTTLDARLLDSTGAALSTAVIATVNVAGVLRSNTGVIAASNLTLASAAAVTTPANDRLLQLRNNSAVNCLKGYALLWLTRG